MVTENIFRVGKEVLKIFIYNIMGKYSIRYFIILILLVIFIYLCHNYYKENFDTNENSQKPYKIDIFIITLRKPERMENIELQIQKIKNSSKSNDINIELIDGVVGLDLNVDEMIKNNIIDRRFVKEGENITKTKKSEIGCYMSHYKCYEKILNNKDTDYTIVFEDDFNIVCEQFMYIIYDTMNNIEKKPLNFDLLYLGTSSENHGAQIENQLYEIDNKTSLYGAHAILYKNKNISNIIEKTKVLSCPIDVILEELSYKNEITSYAVYPNLVKQQHDKFNSTIQIGFTPLNI